MQQLLPLGQCLTYTDKRIPSAANVCRSLQRCAAVCCAASPGRLPPHRNTQKAHLAHGAGGT
eukprot:6821563-Alexandrium_andersonii.AAC.1